MDIKKSFTLKLMSLFTCPIAFFIGASIHEVSRKRCIVKIPLIYRTRNPVGSMFIGALTSGADMAAVLGAYVLAREDKISASILIKDMHAEFIKKVSSSAYFICDDVPKVLDMMKRGPGEPQSCEVMVRCVPSIESEDLLARFRLTVSIKVKA